MSDLSSCLVSRVLTTASGTCTQCLMVNRQTVACAWRRLNGRRRRTRSCNLDGVNPLDRNSWRTSVRRCQVLPTPESGTTAAR